MNDPTTPEDTRDDPGRTIRARPPEAGEATSFFAEALSAETGREETLPTGDVAGGTVVAAGERGYEILEELGRGGMGVVFRARQAVLRREVAIKRLLDRRGAPGPRAQFVSEALVTGYLDHPNIVPVHDLGVNAAGEAFLAMKLVGGRSWKRLLHPRSSRDRDAAERFDRRRHLEVLLAVCNAVNFAHSRGIVHCDLKPENVMVGEFGEVFVMDWGLAVSCRPESEVELPRTRHHSSVRSLCGTPAYMPSELAEGRGADIGPWTDVHLLAAILYEILEGRTPNRGPDVKSVLDAARSGGARRYGDGAPRELVEICERGMAREPADRFASVAGFAAALRDCLEHEESLAIARDARRRLEQLGAVEEGARDPAARGALYGELSEILAGFRQARRLWDRNDRAAEGERVTRRAFARAAVAAGDHALALSHLEGDEEEEGLALATRARDELAERRRSERLARRARRVVAAAVIGALVVLTVGLVVSVRERRRADEQAALAAKREGEAAESARVAREAEETARRNEREAAAAAERYRLALEDVQRLSDSRLLEALIEEEELLHPPEMAIADGMKRWLAKADELVERLPLHRRAMKAVLERARPYGEEDFRFDYGTEFRQIEGLEEQLVEVERLAEEGPDERARGLFRQGAIDIEAKLSELRELVKTPRTAKFEEFRDTWQYAILGTHLARMEDFLAEGGLRDEVAARLRYAETVRERTVDDFASEWRAAAARVAADERFAGLVLVPQVGLVPLGPDPRSGLEEFLHLLSHEGDIPRRGEDGALAFDERWGMVLVLVPGGDTIMGAQAEDPEAPRFDPMAIASLESPLVSVRLDPYLVSKYEMTQAQWVRATGRNPSQYEIGRAPADVEVTGLHPVEGMTWEDAGETLRRLGLALPTEAQWEWMARAGTDAPWYTGRDRETLRGHLNIADESAREKGARWPEIDDWPGFRDGYPFHAPVVGREPNPWGIHDVLSNVREFSDDTFAPFFVSRLDGRGDLAVPLSPAVVLRGGGFHDTTREARVSFRDTLSPKDYGDDHGVRAVRVLETGP
ncbi:MAG: bifunctional serine/threonine-protein kinase/formylglycine-generating enzyme family protein [Planctomycetota bacterium]